MFEFFKTMENFENSVNPEVKTDNSPEACVSPDEPNYIELRSAALNNFDCQFNELIDNYDETLNNNDERRMRKDENIGILFNKIKNNNKRSDQELRKLENHIKRLDKELNNNVNKIEEQKKIISRNKNISDLQNQKLENSTEKSSDIKKWYVILLALIILFIGIQSFLLFKL